MNTIYLMFYDQQTRKIHQDLVGTLDVANDPYLYYEEPYYFLKPEILVGRLDRKRTFGFLRQQTGDIYIDYPYLMDAMHDDIVFVKDGLEAKVVYIIRRALTVVIATVKKHQKGLYFEAETFLEKQLIIDDYPGLVEGHVVLLKVHDIDQHGIYGSVQKIIGHTNDPDIETLKIVHAYEWHDTFSDALLDELKIIQIDMNQEKKERVVLNDALIVTIDGADAKDLDDAIGLTVIDGKYHLHVHIADVSHFVQANSIIDKEAYDRSTSVYLADRVIPMLPHLISNDWCSLNPNEEKLALSCLMVLDEEGKVIDYELKKTVITSKHRLTYREVNQFLLEGKTLENPALELMLTQMNELSQKLKRIRKKRGEIEFSSSELGFVVDAKGQVLDVYERTTDEAEELIESFMLIANETVAEHMVHLDLPSLYRIHEKPDQQKLKQALLNIKKLGLHVNLKHLGRPEPLQQLTKNTTGTPYESIVHMLILRAMQKAKYTHYSDIHYGLGATYYTHFTAPIRRYPDLMLHRLLHLFVFNEAKNTQKAISHYEQILPEVAQHTSEQERKAIQMERDVEKLKSVEFMAHKINAEFKATIVQMMPTGMFIKLQNGIEGFVPLRLLNDYYLYNEEQLTYIGRKGKRYRLGDQIRVVLLHVDLHEKKMDFGIVEKKAKKKRSKGKR